MDLSQIDRWKWCIYLEDHISSVGFEFRSFKMQYYRVYGQTLEERGECIGKEREDREINGLKIVSSQFQYKPIWNGKCRSRVKLFGHINCLPGHAKKLGLTAILVYKPSKHGSRHKLSIKPVRIPNGSVRTHNSEIHLNAFLSTVFLHTLPNFSLNYFNLCFKL